MHQSLLPHIVHFVSRLFNNRRYKEIKKEKHQFFTLFRSFLEEHFSPLSALFGSTSALPANE
jgi:hypothetical protein